MDSHSIQSNGIDPLRVVIPWKSYSFHILLHKTNKRVEWKIRCQIDVSTVVDGNFSNFMLYLIHVISFRSALFFLSIFVAMRILFIWKSISAMPNHRWINTSKIHKLYNLCGWRLNRNNRIPCREWSKNISALIEPFKSWWLTSESDLNRNYSKWHFDLRFLYSLLWFQQPKDTEKELSRMGNLK